MRVVRKFLIALCFSEIGDKRRPDAWATELKRRLYLTSKHIFFISFSGVILKVRNDGSLMPKLTHSMCISAMTDKLQQGDEDFVYILPRNDDMLWLGGLVQPNQWDRNLTLDYAPIRRMFSKIKEFYPPLRSYGDDDVEEVLVGLRPARRGDICLEWDPICSSVLHNYGHGGSGVTLSWGCASEVCALIDHALKRRKLIYVSRL